jgi:DNA-binding MarR family transcriptional regulator
MTAEASVPELAGRVQTLPNCTCSRLRRATRHVTQLYDQSLEAAGLTIGQFGLLAFLNAHGGGVAIGTVAHARGMDPTTLTRNLKPLVAQGWVAVDRDPSDRRVRTISISISGSEKYASARPFWEDAEARLKSDLGPEMMAALNALLELSIAKIAAAKGGP